MCVLEVAVVFEVESGYVDIALIIVTGLSLAFCACVQLYLAK